MKNVPPQIVLCNGANLPKQWAQYKPLVLDYQDADDSVRNIRLALPDFVQYVSHLPDRLLAGRRRRQFQA